MVANNTLIFFNVNQLTSLHLQEANELVPWNETSKTDDEDKRKTNFAVLWEEEVLEIVFY